MEAPFSIKTDPELIRIGYDCGFGSENGAGFGMVEVVEGEKHQSSLRYAQIGKAKKIKQKMKTGKPNTHYPVPQKGA